MRCGFMERGAARGSRCGEFRDAIRSRGAAWTWCPISQILLAMATPLAKPKFMGTQTKTIMGTRSICERAKGNVDRDSLADRSGAVPFGNRGVVAHQQTCAAAYSGSDQFRACKSCNTGANFFLWQLESLGSHGHARRHACRRARKLGRD